MVLRPILPKSNFMLSQQMKSGDWMIEAYVVQSATEGVHPINTPSITFTNCNIQRNFLLRQRSPTASTDHTVALLNTTFGCFSQSTACITTRFGECSTTLLEKLWYLYSYIYHQASSSSTIVIIPILLFLVVALLMPSAALPTTSSIVSLSPFISQTRSFTMADYTPISDWTFKFSDHPLCSRVASGLNNTYSENFNDAVVARLFTNQSCTIVAADAITIIRAAIIDKLELEAVFEI